jgi:octaprenyl-diphosphate synthase
VQRTKPITAQQSETPFMRLIAPDLQRVRRALREIWTDTPPFLRPLVEHGALDRGKLLRPTLVLLAGRMFGSVTHDHIRAATVLELIHNASLLHDDVLDHGLVRRGVPTVNQRWGNQTAVLFGDLLLGKALEISTYLPDKARSALSRIIRRTCDGEMHQIANAGDFALTEPQYLALITEKTAAMFEGACCLGAQVAGAAESECDALGRFGCNTGIAYQIMDDLLDLVGDSEDLCKTLGTDLQGGKLTLPLIHSLRVLPESRRSSALLRLETRRLTKCELLGILAEAGSIDYVLARLGACVKKASAAVQPLRQSLAKAALLDMSRWIARQATEWMGEESAGVTDRRMADGHRI